MKLKENMLLLCLIVWLSPIQAQKSSEKSEFIGTDSLEIWSDAFHFLAIGDWGRKGQYHQQDVADRMEEVARVLDAEFVMSLGDNFYPNGVASVDDPNWNYSFEDVYKGYHLNIPWHVVLGNHDYRGNPQAQLDYTWKSQRWNMPSRYFNYDYELDDEGLLSLVFIDTSPFEHKYYDEEKYGQVWSQDSTRQIQWADSVLKAKSKSSWLIVAGHHPMYSGGKRIEATSDVRSHLEPLLTRNNVDVYFAGHEHDMQYIKPKGKLHHFISGAGSEVRPTGMLDFSKYAISEHGFMAVSVTKDKMLVQVIDYKGNVLQKTVINKN